MTLTVFTYADRRYEPFALPFAFAVLHSNSDCVVEVSLNSPERFRQSNADAISILDYYYPNRVFFTKARPANGLSLERIPPNSLRFLIEPTLKNEFVYIGDIDIVVVDDIMAHHLSVMRRTGLPFSNVVRQNKRALTGLHFTRWDTFYPIPQVPPHSKVNFDEALLYDLVEARGIGMPPETEKVRPLMGYHLSLNTDPRTPSSGWGGIRDPYYLERYRKLAKSDGWRELLPYLDLRIRYTLIVLETYLVTFHGVDATEGLPTPNSKLSELWSA